MAIPDQLVELVAGEPQDGTWEPVFPLLTADADGYPRVCLLSRGELRFERDTVLCVLRSRRTRANLDRSLRALLLVVHGDSAFSLRLTVRGRLSVGGAAAIEFAVERIEEDTLHIPLNPMTYRASNKVRAYERTDENRVLLERLAGSR